LFDEPTNHLDFESREVLANALNTFDGTVIVISHDRYFIEQVCDRVIEIDNSGLVSYPGNYSYYKHKKELNAKSRARRMTPKTVRLIPKQKIKKENRFQVS
jgi:ATP-binding cassette, subfamily F, member 3